LSLISSAGLQQHIVVIGGSLGHGCRNIPRGRSVLSLVSVPAPASTATTTGFIESWLSRCWSGCFGKVRPTIRMGTTIAAAINIATMIPWWCHLIIRATIASPSMRGVIYIPSISVIGIPRGVMIVLISMSFSRKGSIVRIASRRIVVTAAAVAASAM
jgi:hypothetical protein